MVVLPALYVLFSGTKEKSSVKNQLSASLVVLMLISGSFFLAPQRVSVQNKERLTVDAAVKIALRNNPDIVIDSLRIEQQHLLKKTSIRFT
jgi:hypothetical protein